MRWRVKKGQTKQSECVRAVGLEGLEDPFGHSRDGDRGRGREGINTITRWFLEVVTGYTKTLTRDTAANSRGLFVRVWSHGGQEPLNQRRTTVKN